MKNIKRRISALATSLLWGGFTYTGYTLTSAVALRVGYANAGQWHYYVDLPLIMLMVSIALFLLARRLPVALFVTIWSLQLLVFVPFFLGYGGGM